MRYVTNAGYILVFKHSSQGAFLVPLNAIPIRSIAFDRLMIVLAVDPVEFSIQGGSIHMIVFNTLFRSKTRVVTRVSVSRMREVPWK